MVLVGYLGVWNVRELPLGDWDACIVKLVDRSCFVFREVTDDMSVVFVLCRSIECCTVEF